MPTPLVSDNFYHVYNVTVGNEKAFLEKRNYHFFLDKLKKYISPICDVYAYCLIPNHYHLLIKIKTEKEINNYKNELIESQKIKGKFETESEFIVQQFSRMNNSYTKAFNITYNRKGKLFLQSFKRKEVDGNDYFTKLIHYIHSNPVHHKLVNKIDDWEFSSYNSLVSDKYSLLCRNEVFDWFGSKEKFILFHENTHINLH